jgi:hypothetical protein
MYFDKACFSAQLCVWHVLRLAVLSALVQQPCYRVCSCFQVLCPAFGEVGILLMREWM